MSANLPPIDAMSPRPDSSSGLTERNKARPTPKYVSVSALNLAQAVSVLPQSMSSRNIKQGLSSPPQHQSLRVVLEEEDCDELIVPFSAEEPTPSPHLGQTAIPIKPLKLVVEEQEDSEIVTFSAGEPTPNANPEAEKQLSHSSAAPITFSPLKHFPDLQAAVNHTPPTRIKGADQNGIAAQKGNANGVYEIRDRAGTPLGIFKPNDEERGMPNCPKAQYDRSKEGISPGEGWEGEVLAGYFSPDLVQPTALVSLTSDSFCYHGALSEEEAKRPKQGSFQRFIPDFKPLNGLSPEEQQKVVKKTAKLQKEQLYVLDIRGYNTDRHLGNLSTRLEPIDHGCMATRCFKDHATLCWMDWEDSQEPFSEQMKQKIAQFDWQKDESAILEKMPDLDKEKLFTLKYTNLLLQKGAAAGLSPYEIGSFLVGHDFGPSIMRTLYEKASQLTDVDAAMERMIDKSIAFLISQESLRRPSAISRLFCQCFNPSADERKEAIRAAVIAHL